MPLAALVVEDDPAFADALRSLLLADSRFTPVHVVSRLDSARRYVARQPIDLCVIDLNLPDGDGCNLVQTLSESIICVVLTVSGREADVVRALESGASGYLLKDEPDLLQQLASVVDGSFPISARVAAHLVKQWRRAIDAGKDAAATTTRLTPHPALSERELEILTVLAQGHTYQETGELLRISHHTVADHVKNIYRKLAVNSRSGAVYQASQLGYLNLREQPPGA